jgi:hypothetical protein
MTGVWDPQASAEVPESLECSKSAHGVFAAFLAHCLSNLRDNHLTAAAVVAVVVEEEEVAAVAAKEGALY